MVLHTGTCSPATLPSPRGHAQAILLESVGHLVAPRASSLDRSYRRNWGYGRQTSDRTESLFGLSSLGLKYSGCVQGFPGIEVYAISEGAAP